MIDWLILLGWRNWPPTSLYFCGNGTINFWGRITLDMLCFSPSEMARGVHPCWAARHEVCTPAKHDHFSTPSVPWTKNSFGHSPYRGVSFSVSFCFCWLCPECDEWYCWSVSTRNLNQPGWQLPVLLLLTVGDQQPPKSTTALLRQGILPESACPRPGAPRCWGCHFSPWAVVVFVCSSLIYQIQCVDIAMVVLYLFVDIMLFVWYVREITIR